MGSAVDKNTLLNEIILSNGKTADGTFPIEGAVQFEAITVNGINLTATQKDPILEKDLVIKVRFSRMVHTATFFTDNGHEPAQLILYSGAEMTLPADSDDQFIYVAGAKRDGEKLLSAGGRVLGVTAVADRLDDAIKKAYAHVEKVEFENGYHRSDIGARALKALNK